MFITNTLHTLFIVQGWLKNNGDQWIKPTPWRNLSRSSKPKKARSGPSMLLLWSNRANTVLLTWKPSQMRPMPWRLRQDQLYHLFQVPTLPIGIFPALWTEIHRTSLIVYLLRGRIPLGWCLQSGGYSLGQHVTTFVFVVVFIVVVGDVRSAIAVILFSFAVVAIWKFLQFRWGYAQESHVGLKLGFW